LRVLVPPFIIQRHLLETVMSLCVRRLIPFVAAAATVQALAAQEPRRLSQPDSIPLELAGALIASGGFGTEPQILVGMLPGWMNSRVFLPPNGRVLGSAFIGSVTVGVLAVSEQPDIAVAQFKTELAKRGWTAPPPPQQSYSGGGFRPAQAQFGVDQSPVTRLILCGGDQQMLMVNAARRSGTTTQIVYRVTPAGGPYGTCSPQAQRGGGDRLPVPTLINPAEMTDFRNYGNCSSHAQGSGTSGNIRTTVSLDSLVRHYAKQMQDSGWHATSATTIGRTWSRTDSSGKLLEARITASASPQDSLCRDLNLMVWEIRKP
jgi:hypothetical protein